jgi:hypothetical protein
VYAFKFQLKRYDHLLHIHSVELNHVVVVVVVVIIIIVVIYEGKSKSKGIFFLIFLSVVW